MSTGFVHSIKVPRFYKTTAKLVQSVREEGASLKQVLYQKKHPNIKGIYALALSTLQHGSQLDIIMRKTRILLNEQRLDPWLARVLIAELLWGKKILQSECKPVQTVLSYEKQLHEEAAAVSNLDIKPNIKKVEKPRYVRINTLKITIQQAISSFRKDGWYYNTVTSKSYSDFLNAVKHLEEDTFLQDIHVPELLIFRPRTQFHDCYNYNNREIILQDKASCLSAFLLNPKPNSVVLDMCAAPGMKTTHLAAILQNKGKIYAVERDSRRYGTLREFVQTTEATCVETINDDAMTLDSEKYPDVEYILVDPSCSGSGMLDRINFDDGEKRCPPSRLKSLQSFQVLLLRHALLAFPSVKRVVYSTCSLYPEENEQVIEEILSDIRDSYKLVSIKDVLNNVWVNTGSTKYTGGDKCLYAKPEVDLTNGFFAAVFERNSDVPLPEYNRKSKVLKKDRQEVEIDNNTGNNTESNSLPKKRRKKRKKNSTEEKKEENEENLLNENVTAHEETENVEEKSVAKKRRKKKKEYIDKGNGEEVDQQVLNGCEYEVSDNHAEGSNDDAQTKNTDVLKLLNMESVDKKHRKKHKNKVKEDESMEKDVGSSNQTEEQLDDLEKSTLKKKKKKKKHKEQESQDT